MVNMDKSKTLIIKLRNQKSFNLDEWVLESDMSEFHVRESLWTHCGLLRLFLFCIILRKKR